jgi:hypothetical protein
MKKLLLSAALLFGMQAFAQTDLQVTFTSPSDGDSILRGRAFVLSASFKNVGTTVIERPNVILMTFRLNNQPVNVTVNGNNIETFTIQVPENGLASGDSVMFNMPNVNFPVVSQAGARTFCTIGVIFDGTEIVPEPTDNNISCVNLNFGFAASLSPAAIAAKTVKVYPNPAQNFVNIDLEYNGQAQIKIVDITGKVVYNGASTLKNNKIDISDLKRGMYFYEIRTESNEIIKSGKFNINN